MQCFRKEIEMKHFVFVKLQHFKIGFVFSLPSRIHLTEVSHCPSRHQILLVPPYIMYPSLQVSLVQFLLREATLPLTGVAGGSTHPV